MPDNHQSPPTRPTRRGAPATAAPTMASPANDTDLDRLYAAKIDAWSAAIGVPPPVPAEDDGASARDGNTMSTRSFR